MKTSLLHKVFSVTVSLLVLTASLSLTIEKHFCGDVLVDVAIFSESEKCTMEAFEIEQAKITKKNCCKDEVDVIEGIDEMTLQPDDDLSDLQQQVLVAFALSYKNLFEGLPTQSILHKNYNPPNLIKDIQILHETFLI